MELINPRCILDKTHRVITRISAHMYVRLDKIQPQTEIWIKESWRKGKWSPNSVINGEGVLIDARLKSGLRPSPVTRDLKWGVPVPVSDDDPDQEMKEKVFCECPPSLSFFLQLISLQMFGWAYFISHDDALPDHL